MLTLAMATNGTGLGKQVPLDERHAVRKNPKTELVEDMQDLVGIYLPHRAVANPY
jgi:hypothetical protein